MSVVFAHVSSLCVCICLRASSPMYIREILLVACGLYVCLRVYVCLCVFACACEQTNKRTNNQTNRTHKNEDMNKLTDKHASKQTKKQTTSNTRKEQTSKHTNEQTNAKMNERTNKHNTHTKSTKKHVQKWKRMGPQIFKNRCLAGVLGVLAVSWANSTGNQ